MRRGAPGEGWTPLVPTAQPVVFASLWISPGLRLWTLVKRSKETVGGELLKLELAAGEPLWDAVTGREISSAAATLCPRGIGCFIAVRQGATGKDFAEFLAVQAATETKANWDASFPAEIRTRLKPVPATRAYPVAKLPAEMVAICCAAAPAIKSSARSGILAAAPARSLSRRKRRSPGPASTVARPSVFAARWICAEGSRHAARLFGLASGSEVAPASSRHPTKAGKMPALRGASPSSGHPFPLPNRKALPHARHRQEES